MTNTFPEVDKCLQSLFLFFNDDLAVSDLFAEHADLALPSLSLLLDNVRIVAQLQEELFE